MSSGYQQNKLRGVSHWGSFSQSTIIAEILRRIKLRIKMSKWRKRGQNYLFLIFCMLLLLLISFSCFFFFILLLPPSCTYPEWFLSFPFPISPWTGLLLSHLPWLDLLLPEQVSFFSVYLGLIFLFLNRSRSFPSTLAWSSSSSISLFSPSSFLLPSPR